MFVVTTAVYVFAASMHVGGALAKVIVLAALPSAAGHGVSPVSVAPGIVLGSGVVVVVGPALVVEPNRSIVVVVLVADAAAVVLGQHSYSGDGGRDQWDQQQVHAGALALPGTCLTGELFQALLAIGLLAFTFRGSHEHGRLAGGPTNTAGSMARTCRDVRHSSRRTLVPIPLVSSRGSLRQPRPSETRRMNRRAHGLGRGLTCLGLLSTAAYLGWRIATLPSRTPTWLVVVALAVEIVGFLGSILLTWALWPTGRPSLADTLADPTPGRRRGANRPATDSPCQGHVAGHAVDGRRPTRRRRPRGQTRDRRARRRVRRGVRGARPRRSQRPEDLQRRFVDTALLACWMQATSPVPMRSAVLLPLIGDDRVAVAIGQSLMADDDSAEHGPNGLHELTFERREPQPGARGERHGDPRRIGCADPPRRGRERGSGRRTTHRSAGATGRWR